jgi:ferritin-like metal-binding protein YciE
MPEHIEQQLIKYLSEAHAMERQALVLLRRAASIVGDEEVARIYRAHELQTKEHVRYVAERLAQHGRSPSKLKDAGLQAAGLGLGGVIRALPDTPVRVATAAFTFENLEIAAYRFIRSLAERAGDADTVAVAERILEQEEAAAELVGGTFDRSVELLLGEPGRSPLVGVTPIGKPSERPSDGSEHEGPQSFKSKPADEPAHPPRDIETPVAPLAPPEPGYPADQPEPEGGEVPPPHSPGPVPAQG